MEVYRIAGQELHIPSTISEILPYKILDEGCTNVENMPIFVESVFSHSSPGWVGNAYHQVEVWTVFSGIFLKVSGGCSVYISDNERCLVPTEAGKLKSDLGEFDRAILLGPALVLALAMRSTWSLHASSAIFKNQTFAFLGESGQGKSTLAAYLDSENWDRVADDILPATLEASGGRVWPHFPQLKLPPDKQPGFNFPEQLPLDRICVLDSADKNAEPELELLLPSQAIQVLLSHTAGTRLFEPKLLKKHLDFCAGVAEQTPVYRLAYPHRRDALPLVKKLLENLC